MLSEDIDDINEMIGVVPECEPYRESWLRIKTALAASTNTDTQQPQPENVTLRFCCDCGVKCDKRSIGTCFYKLEA